MMLPEERQAVEDFIRNHSHLSDRKIAEALGKSPMTIRLMRMRLFPKQERSCRRSENAAVSKSQILPVSEARLLEIARQCGLKYFHDDHPEFEELVQEILLGVLERGHEYDPSRDTADIFIVSVARQEARNRIRERRMERETVYRNHRSRIPYPMKHREAGEADEHGRLRFFDLDLFMKRLESLLPPELLSLFRLLKKEWPEAKIRAKTGWDHDEYHRLLEELEKHVQRIFQKNIFFTAR